MIKELKSYLLFLLLGTICISSHAQRNPNTLDIITEKFNTYVSLFPREEIYIHTDRQEYISGEDIWFGIYLTDRKNQGLSSGSRIAYIEILNKDNRAVLQKRISLDNGYGPGQIQLPDTLSTGSYLLRAYTNWMKNFLPSNCFIKKLVIFNSLSEKGYIEDLNYTFQGVVAISDSPQQDTEPSGIKAEIDYSDPGSLRINYTVEESFLKREGNQFYFLVQTHGVINYKSPVTFTERTKQIDIPKNLLIPGLNDIVLFNSSAMPVIEVYSFTQPVKKETLAITSPDNTGVRDKVSLGIEIMNAGKLSGDIGSFSISAATSGGIYFPGINDYMIFGSEFGAIPEKVFQTFEEADRKLLPATLLSSLKSNWIDWDAIMNGINPLVKYKREDEKHYIYGQLINGNTRKPDPGKFLFLSIPGKNAFFKYSLTDKSGEFSFELPLDGNLRDIIIQPEEVERGNSIKIESSFSEKYPRLTRGSESAPNQIGDLIVRHGINYQIMKIYSTEELLLKTRPAPYAVTKRRFYGKPDIELTMSDYINLPVMQEVFFELMPGVFLKKRKDKYEVSLVEPVEDKILDKPPILFVDGVVVDDPAVIANLDPELVEKIDALRVRYFVGEYMFYGLVNVITKAGDFSNITLPDYAVRMQYLITEPVKSFQSPDYSRNENKVSRLPDFRNTLYWNPSPGTVAQANSGITFWTSDFRSDYEVNIQGVTSSGEFVSLKKIIKVR